VKGKEYAEDYLDLTSKLREKNLFYTQYTEIEEKQQDAKYKFKTADLAFLCRQLASMLTAGISLVKSLHIPTHALIKKDEGNGLKVDSMLLGEQIRVISEQRIIEKVGRITDKDSLKEIQRVYLANFEE
jgi:hypothetical protein